MSEAVFVSGEGERAKTSVISIEDTNLMLGLRKSAFTLQRSNFKDSNGNVQHEYWCKCCDDVNGFSSYENFTKGSYNFYGIWSKGNLFYNGLRRYRYPTRPNGRPIKLVLDSLRTVLVDDFSGSRFYGDYMWSQSGCWRYVGSSVEGVFEKETSGNFDLYGNLFGISVLERFYDGTSRKIFPVAKMICSMEQLSENDLRSLCPVDDYYVIIGSNWNYEFIFSGKIAEVRNWEIISNNTPEQNTYYVAIENKKGELLDVKTTTTFGVTVGSVASEFADRMSESQKNTRVVDDLVIRI